jgi:catechol 2,3-dioxygenase-like lactoylglutathione lyase family enzyme
MSIKVTALDHVAVNVTDLEQARNFYGGVLGLEEIERPASFDFPGAWYRTGNALIHLVAREPQDAPSSRHFCLWVEDVHTTAEMLETAGFEITWDKRKISGLDRFFTHDPDGNRIEFQGSDGTLWPA